MMPQIPHRISKSRAPRTGVDRVVFSEAARNVIMAACRRGQRQAVVLSWPGGATYLPDECYAGGTFDVLLGHVAGCPIYADSRQLEMFPDRRVLLDAEHSSPNRPHPPLRVRTLPRP